MVNARRYLTPGHRQGRPTTGVARRVPHSRRTRPAQVRYRPLATVSWHRRFGGGPLPSTAVTNALSLPERARRQTTVDIIIRLLRRAGLAAGTAEARRGTPSTPQEANAIIDAAFAVLMEQFLEQVQDAAAMAPDPLSALWRATETFLDPSQADTDSAPARWHELQRRAGATNRPEAVAELTERTLRFFTNLVTATGTPEPADLASTWVSCLIGAVARQSVHARPVRAIVEELSFSFGLPLPSLAR